MNEKVEAFDWWFIYDVSGSNEGKWFEEDAYLGKRAMTHQALRFQLGNLMLRNRGSQRKSPPTAGCMGQINRLRKGGGGHDTGARARATRRRKSSGRRKMRHAAGAIAVCLLALASGQVKDNPGPAICSTRSVRRRGAGLTALRFERHEQANGRR